MVGGITDSMDLSLSKLRDMVKDRKAWRAAVHGVEQSQTRLSDYTTMDVAEHYFSHISYKRVISSREGVWLYLLMVGSGKL